ncbi:MAG TPA: zf-HC2 domain-containing protein [Planctomycetota bacterium]|nr:zf-HC2 domain-containing protein [Planctomycetota bacterium]
MSAGCGYYQSDFWRALDGELPEAESTALAVHLRTCPVCRGVAAASVAMHRHLLEVTEQLQLPVERGSTTKAASVGAPRASSISRAVRIERLPARVIVIDWRLFAVAALILLTALAWALPGGAADGAMELRQALQIRSFLN